MRLAYDYLIFSLLAVPIFWLLLHASVRKKLALRKSFIDDSVTPVVFREAPLWERSLKFRRLIASLALLLLIAAALRPQWGFTWRESKKHGVDIVVALDISDSMLARDVAPDRLTRAKREVLDFLSKLKGDRIGLVLFSGTAFLELPLTLDYAAFKLFADSVEAELIPIKGTNIELAVSVAIKAFLQGAPETPSPARPARDRALVLITDGEDFDGDLGAAKALAKEHHVRIYVIGVGTEEGAPIPTDQGYKTDKQGQVVITKLKQGALQQLAEQTGGIYVKSIASEKDAVALYELGIRRNLKGSDLSWTRSKIWHEHFQIPLALALVLIMLLLWGKPAPKSDSFIKPTFEKRSSPTYGLLAVFFLAQAACPSLLESALAQSPEYLGKRGRELYLEGKHPESLDSFERAEEKSAKDARFKLGRGSALYRLQDYAEAKAAFFEASSLTRDPLKKAEALYNAGNAMVQTGEFEEAIRTYEDSLKLNPNDKETKDNLELAKKLLEQKKQQEKEQNKNEENSRNSQEEKQKKEKQPQQKEQQEQDKKSSSSEDSQADENSSSENSENKDKKENAQEKSQQKEDNKGAKPRQKDRAQQQQDSSPTATNPEKNENHSYNQGIAQQLDSIEEKPAARMKYRFREGLNQLERNDRKLPEKDW